MENLLQRRRVKKAEMVSSSAACLSELKPLLRSSRPGSEREASSDLETSGSDPASTNQSKAAMMSADH